MDRAEAVMDKKEIKIVKSKDRARTVQERAKAWDELNKKMIAKKEREAAALDLALGKENLLDEDWEEDVMEEVDVEAVIPAVEKLGVLDSTPVQEQAAAAADEIDDEL